MFEYLHLDVIPIIFSYLSQYELLSILLTNKLIYYQIMKYINTIKFIIIDDNRLLYDACKNNLIISVKQIKFKFYLDIGLIGVCKGLDYACYGGHESIVKLMIKKGADNWNAGLSCACYGGHESIVKFMIDKGATDWDTGLYVACQSGYINIVKLMIDKGADNWNGGLYSACQSGYIDIVKLMIDKGADNWNGGLHGACESKNKSIIKLMIEKGATSCYRCNKSISEHL